MYLSGKSWRIKKKKKTLLSNFNAYSYRKWVLFEPKILTPVIHQSALESSWSSGCPLWRSVPRWRSVSGHKGHLRGALVLLQALASDCLWACHHDGTGLPLQALWAGGVSSSTGTGTGTGTMTPAEHGKKRHILAFAMASFDVICRLFSMLHFHFAGIFVFALIRVIFKSNTCRTKSKRPCKDGGRAAEISGSLLWQYLCWVFQQLSGAKHWRIMKFRMKSLFLTYIVRLYMLIWYWSCS